MFNPEHLIETPVVPPDLPRKPKKPREEQLSFKLRYHHWPVIKWRIRRTVWFISAPLRWTLFGAAMVLWPSFRRDICDAKLARRLEQILVKGSSNGEYRLVADWRYKLVLDRGRESPGIDPLGSLLLSPRKVETGSYLRVCGVLYKVMGTRYDPGSMGRDGPWEYDELRVRPTTPAEASEHEAREQRDQDAYWARIRALATPLNQRTPADEALLAEEEYDDEMGEMHAP